MNKVFLELSGKPILVRTLLKFSASPSVDRLIVVVGADEVSMIERVLAKVPKLKPWKVTAGGWSGSIPCRTDWAASSRRRTLFSCMMLRGRW